MTLKLLLIRNSCETVKVIAVEYMCWDRNAARAFPSFLSLKQLGLKFVKGLRRRIYQLKLVIRTRKRIILSESMNDGAGKFEYLK